MSALTELPAPLLEALKGKGFESLTEVQEAVLDPDLGGTDLLVSAQTGSGKTLAFGLALAGGMIEEGERLLPPDTPRALIIAPTRELALQVGRELEWLYAPAGAVITHCVGGMDPRAERRALERGAHIVVGTPGRLRDHLERGSLDPATIATVVLDEADEMLDLGFREDLEFMLGQLPTPRRTLMFSATVSPEIERLARTYMDKPHRLAVGPRKAQHSDISYQALVVDSADHETAIVNVLRYHEARNAIVFCKTRAAVNHLTARFHNRGFAVVPLSGELAQEERARALQSLRDGRARVCVATDVAARGIDLPGLDLVIHADLPGSTETLLHRSGRTGRAGNKGVSVLIVPLPARKKVQRLFGGAGLSAEWKSAPSAADVSARDTERLLLDEVLTKAESPDEAGIITTLAERFTARELAAAVARQYFSARSAPEDITAVDPREPASRPGERFERPERGERGERAERGPKGEGFVKNDRGAFQPGPWFRLSVGAEDGAEPRWLLPMICRAGDLTREDIGAIRVQEDHTLVQLSVDGGEKFVATIADTMALDDNIQVEKTGAPDLSTLKFVKMGGPRDRRESKRDGFGGGDRSERPARAPFRRDEESDSRPPRKAYEPRPANEGPRPARSYEDRPKRDYGDKPKRDFGDRPARSFDDRPKRDYGDKPKRDFGDRPARSFDDRPKRDFGDKPKRDFGDRPTRSGEGFGGKPAGKFGGKPAGKFGGKPAGARFNDDAPARPRFDAEALRDPSARLGGKPRAGAKAGGKSGDKPAPRPYKGKYDGDKPPSRGPAGGGFGGSKAPRKPRG